MKAEERFQLLIDRLEKEKSGDIYKTEGDELKRLINAVQKKKNEITVLAESARRDDMDGQILDRIIAVAERLDEDLARLNRVVEKILHRPRGQPP
jgi:hypothetical protein